MKTLKLLTYSMCLLVMAMADGMSQTADSQNREQIAVMARPSPDSITLRWAPATFHVWRLANQNGYRIERYVIMRNGRLLPQMETSIMDAVIRPLSEDRWERLVKDNRYAAIAAQALYGNDFHLDLSQSDIFSIVNKVQENEQRFAFALFAADMDPAVARASGLWYTDTTVHPGEKYLYRIVVNVADTLRGSVFVGPKGRGPLPAPRNLHGDFREQLVSLRWENDNHHYSAYTVERSVDGQTFSSISDTPMVTVSPSEDEHGRYEYAIDSLRDLSKTYHYRVIGITPFGEKSPPSATVSGKGTVHVSQVPYITEANSSDNASMQIAWDFPAQDNRAIVGFHIERASSPKGKFLPLTRTLLDPNTRTWTDKMPGLVNYYRTKAVGRDGQVYASPVYFAQLIDSVPPTPPAGLRATVDDKGRIILWWHPNPDHDLLGYRVYKGYHDHEEPAQITTGPISDTTFTDHVNLYTLNEKVCYRVMAVDLNLNHSALSAGLTVALPDKVQPQPPVFLPAKSDEASIALAWIASPSDDVVAYSVYRKSADAPGWALLKTLPARQDSLYTYSDRSTSAGVHYYYTVIATDDAGLESDPADPVVGRATGKLFPPVEWRKPAINREENRLTLRWRYEQSSIASFRLYASVDDLPPVLYRTLRGDEVDFSDKLIPGRRYTYRLMAQFRNGAQSALSEPLVIEY